MTVKSISSQVLKGTDLVHADDGKGHPGQDVAPSISVSTTYRTSDPRIDPRPLSDLDPFNPTRNFYSRYTRDVNTRVEKILSKINDGFALTYASGLAASYASLVFYAPKRIAISEGYHGSHVTVQVYKKSRGNDLQIIGIDDEFKKGDLCWLETPLNPTGESRNIKFYADKVHAAGGYLIVDSTFAPPPLQYPFKWGADCVLHSGTKYLGGHSDLLCGVLVVRTIEEWLKLWDNRAYLGSMMGSLESWLLLRSLRTLHLRVPRQSATATQLAQWLNRMASVPAGEELDGVKGGLIDKVWHSSLQAETADWDVKSQMEGGWNATFSIFLKDKEHATLLPHLLKYFIPASSLGGVESLIEQHVQIDPGTDPRLLRLSVGVEEFEDLKNDFGQAFKKILLNTTQQKAKL